MKIELPLETWIEVFAFVPRSQLKQLVPQPQIEWKINTQESESRERKCQQTIGDRFASFLLFFMTCGMIVLEPQPHIEETHKPDDSQERKCQQTIGDRQFVSYVQFFLHKCGKINLRDLYICGIEPRRIINKENRELPLADVPIPENIKNFKSILISCRNLDKSVLAFLQKFQQNSLLDNVNLRFSDCTHALLEIMTDFLPLFTNINSIKISMHSKVLECWTNSKVNILIWQLLCLHPQEFYVLSCYNGRKFWFCDWLHIPREDGKPRVLILDGYNQQMHIFDRSFSHSHFIRHVKKDFLEANQAVSFFVILQNFWSGEDNVQSITLENGQTQEKLVIIGGNGSYYDPVKISRCPIGTNEEEWIEERLIEQMGDYPNIANRQIVFSAL